MNKTIQMVAFLLLLPTSSQNALYKLPPINGICIIELKNGEKIEGVILIAKGVSEGTFYRSNGFYFINNFGNEIVKYFAPNITEIVSGIEPTSYRKSGYWRFFQWDGEKYYLNYLGRDNNISQNEVIFHKNTNGNTKLLTLDIVYHLMYEYLDHIPVYERVPDELYLDDVKSIIPIHIKVNDISEFIINCLPSEKWLSDIKSVESAFRMKYPDSLYKVGAPIWFHDLDRRKSEILFNPWEH